MSLEPGVRLEIGFPSSLAEERLVVRVFVLRLGEEPEPCGTVEVSGAMPSHGGASDADLILEARGAELVAGFIRLAAEKARGQHPVPPQEPPPA